MAVLVPLNNANALQRFHDAGVGEIYVGFHDDGWEARFGSAELNRMSGFGREANPFDFGEMCSLLRQARDLGMRGFVCFNASSYTPEQNAHIVSAYLPRIADSGADGIIVSGQALVASARDAGLGVVMSTVAGVFNERLAAYYRDCGATRIILPRDLSHVEIAGIMQAVPDVEYEAFLMRNGCMFSDSHCLGCHRAGHPSLCMSLRTGDWHVAPAEWDGSASWQRDEAYGAFEERGANGTDEAREAYAANEAYVANGRHDAGGEDAFLQRAIRNEWLLNEHYHRRTCGMCALWRFEQLGVAAYKVVGRGDDVDDLVADAALVARNVALARSCATERDYLSSMELPRDPATLCGTKGLSCYYPELARRERR